MTGNVNVKYQRLSQVTQSDDEDEGFAENILFDSRLVNTPTDHSRYPLDFERLGFPKSRSKRGFPHCLWNRGKQTYALAAVFLILAGATALAVLFPILHQKLNSGSVTNVPHGFPRKDWDHTFANTWTESSIYLQDIDKDGLDDIIIGLAEQMVIEALLSRPKNTTIREYCKLQGFPYPCGGSLTALRGYDGAQMWTSPTRSVIIYQSCGDIDVNGDSLNDCIVTGRHSTCQAVDLRSGQPFWVVDPDSPVWSSHFMPGWNVYQSVALPDLDKDGFADILISHGGDKDKEPSDYDRQAGRLILLSGKSGHPIGKNFLELPDKKETYMPPVKYVTNKGAIYVLIGSGGETVPGNLYAISLIDIYKHASGSSSLPDVPGLVEVAYDWLATKRKDQNGFVTLFSGQKSGVMVPPIIIDHESDGHVDILVSSFDGQIALLDGQSLAVKWSRTFDGMESYSSPSPGLFDEDTVLDFLVHMNEGVWDRYNGSQSIILNGVDGSILWSIDSQSYAYSSDMSLRTLDGKTDVFLLKVVGLNSNDSQITEYEDLEKRHLGHPGVNEKGKPNPNAVMSAEEFQVMCNQVMSHAALEHPVCDADLDSLTQEVFLMDPLMSSSLVKVIQQKAERHHYQLNHTLGSYHCHPLSSRQKDKIDMCEVLVPTSYTGAVTDVDGDQSLDYIHISQMTGTLNSDTLSAISYISNVVLSKRSLQKVIDRKEVVHLDLEGQEPVPEPSLLEHLQSLKFKSHFMQSWNQYLGSTGHSYYHIPKS